MSAEPYYSDEFATIYHGDCVDVMAQLAASLTADAIITDLPYGTTSCKWDTVIPFQPFWAACRAVVKPSGVIVTTASQPFAASIVMSNVAEFRHEWVWIKNAGSNFANTVREPMKEHESVLVFGQGKWTYNRQMQERAPSGLARAKHAVRFDSQSENYREFEGRDAHNIGTLRVPSSWQKFNRQRGLHPTQKPVDLFAYLVRTYTNPGDVVLDCCAGSGTTGVACRQEGRRFIGIELEERYCEVAARRLSQRTLDLGASA